MSYQVPTLEQTIERARERFRAELPGTDSAIWPNNVFVAAKVLGAEVFELYAYLQYLEQSRFAHLANGDQLDAHGVPYGLTRFAAAQAVGTVKFAGTATTAIPAGTTLSRSDNVQFETRVATTIGADGTVDVEIQSLDTGPNTNTLPDSVLDLDGTITGVDATATVDDDGLTGGSDLENDESFRRRILLRKRFPPHGGAVSDYKYWALSQPGVTRVWVEGLAYGPGTVGVWFAMDDSTSNGIPTAANVQAVADYIEAERPVTARVTVAAPLPATINVCIRFQSTPNSATLARIESELQDMFRREVEFSTPLAPYTLPQNAVWQAVARATGNSTHTIVTPSTDLSIQEGYLPVLGTILSQ